VAKDGTQEYFHRSGLTSTGSDQTVEDLLAIYDLPSELMATAKILDWKAEIGGDVECGAGQSSNTVYVVYDEPVLTVESQENKPTAKRLDFCMEDAATGQSDKMAICSNIVQKISDEMNGGGSVGKTHDGSSGTDPPPSSRLGAITEQH